VHLGTGSFLDLAESFGVGLADRAGHRPWHPGRVFQRPLLHVEVERPDPGEDVDAAVARTWAVAGFVDVADPLLPVAGHLGGQVQRVDAGMVAFQVGPEIQGQRAHEVAEGAVVQGGATFLAVADNDISDRVQTSRCRSTSSAVER
jgi:hypothetical protein